MIYADPKRESSDLLMHFERDRHNPRPWTRVRARPSWNERTWPEISGVVLRRSNESWEHQPKRFRRAAAGRIARWTQPVVDTLQSASQLHRSRRRQHEVDDKRQARPPNEDQGVARLRQPDRCCMAGWAQLEQRQSSDNWIDRRQASWHPYV